MTKSDNMQDDGGSKALDIGWKQFTISLFDLVRWPVAVVVIFFLLRTPLEKLLDAIASAFRG